MFMVSDCKSREGFRSSFSLRCFSIGARCDVWKGGTEAVFMFDEVKPVFGLSEVDILLYSCRIGRSEHWYLCIDTCESCGG
jgi:hypothetical protein